MAKRGKARDRQIAQQAPKDVKAYPAPSTRGSSFYGEFKQSQYVSQLHDPDDVAKYEQLFPGATKIMFEEFQKQSEHRRHIEKVVVEGNVRQQNRGPIYGLIIVILALGVGTLLTVLGYSIAGISTLLGTLTVPLGVFITGRVVQQVERRDKDRNA